VVRLLGPRVLPDYTPLETGLDRFVRYNKPADFIGKAAAAADKARRHPQAGSHRDRCP
jgi:glycine cleavage system aminomethyltransferase T